MGVCNRSMFCCTLLYVHSSFAIILMGKRELVGLLSLSSWCLLIVVWFFLAVSWVCLQFVIVVFPDHTHLLFWERNVLLPYRAAWIIIQRILSKGKKWHTIQHWHKQCIKDKDLNSKINLRPSVSVTKPRGV